jgi:hypothetical protein
MDWKQQLESLERNGDWSEAVKLVQRAVQSHRDDVEVYVRAIYLTFTIIVEDEQYPGKNNEEIERLLKQYFREGYKRYRENAEYLFFVGFFMTLAHWHFGEGLEFAHSMQKRAIELDPGNMLFEWTARYCAKALGPSPPLAKRMIEEKTEYIDWLKTKGAPGDYLIYAINSDYDRATKDQT